MPKPTEVVRKDENGRTRSSSYPKIESFDTSCLELDLSEMGMFPAESIEVKHTSTIDLSQDKIDAFQREFDGFLIEAIDESLTSLGEPVKNAVFQHLQNDFGIEKKKIPSQIEKFSDIIHKIFGLGACRLEIKFMKNLNSKLEVSIQWPEYEWPLSKWILTDMSFVEYVHHIRKNYGVQCQKTVNATVQR